MRGAANKHVGQADNLRTRFHCIYTSWLDWLSAASANSIFSSHDLGVPQHATEADKEKRVCLLSVHWLSRHRGITKPAA